LVLCLKEIVCLFLYDRKKETAWGQKESFPDCLQQRSERVQLVFFGSLAQEKGSKLTLHSLCVCVCSWRLVDWIWCAPLTLPFQFNFPHPPTSTPTLSTKNYGYETTTALFLHFLAPCLMICVLQFSLLSIIFLLLWRITPSRAFVFRHKMRPSWYVILARLVCQLIIYILYHTHIW